MTWAMMIPLIIQGGVALAERLSQLVDKNEAPTSAEWAELRALEAQNARFQMGLTLAKAGIDITSEKGKAFMALVG